MKLHLMLAASLAGTLAFSLAHAQSAERGKTLFQSECAACHSTMPGQNGIGPSLAGVYGHKAAITPGYNFSQALKMSNVVWTDDSLEKYLKDPNAFISGIKMPQVGTEMHVGVPNPRDRADIVLYLKTLRSK